MKTVRTFFYKKRYLCYQYVNLIAILNKEEEWDGTFNGKPLPEDDYWFHAIIDLELQEKGHFSLIR